MSVNQQHGTEGWSAGLEHSKEMSYLLIVIEDIQDAYRYICVYVRVCYH